VVKQLATLDADWGLEIRNWKLEIGNWKLETGNRQPQSPISSFHFLFSTFQFPFSSFMLYSMPHKSSINGHLFGFDRGLLQ
jgi:hypothetical protein